MTRLPGATSAAPGPRPRQAASRSARQAARRTAASARPVARVAVDVPLPHLDHLFDYLVPEPLAERAVPGCRVRVRFAGRLTGGYLVERAEKTEHHGRLAFLERVLSPEPVLSEEIAGLARAVADRYGGTLADVLRLAIPPRHGAAEAAPPWPAARPAVPPDRPGNLACGPATVRAHRFSPPWPMAGARARSGRRCPGPTGPPRSRRRSARRPPADEGRWSSCRTPGILTSSMQRWRRCSATARTSACPRSSGRPSGTADG